MSETNCDICGAAITSKIKDTYFINNEQVCFCKTCWKYFMDSNSLNPQVKMNALTYYKNASERKAMTPAGQTCIDIILRPEDAEPIRSSDSESTGKPVEGTGDLHNGALADFSMRFIVAGIVFAVLALILYITSIKEIQYGYDTIQVANIQATVFSAANAVSAVVCFAAAGIIRYISKTKR